MKRWRLLGMMCTLLFVGCVILVICIVVSDGGDVAEFKAEVGKGKELIDWKKLKQLNPNIYAWISVPGTNIDYPVVQSDINKDEDFYLNHNIKNQYAFAGSIYTQKGWNGTDFADPVTVLYGHSMVNGSMFGTLKYFEDSSFFMKHKFFYVYMPGITMKYKIVSYYEDDASHLISNFQTEYQYGFESYLKYITADHSGNLRKGLVAGLDTEDRIVTLSTCSSMENRRRLLHGVLEEQTKK